MRIDIDFHPPSRLLFVFCCNLLEIWYILHVKCTEKIFRGLAVGRAMQFIIDASDGGVSQINESIESREPNGYYWARMFLDSSKNLGSTVAHFPKNQCSNVHGQHDLPNDYRRQTPS